MKLGCVYLRTTPSYEHLDRVEWRAGYGFKCWFNGGDQPMKFISNESWDKSEALAYMRTFCMPDSRVVSERAHNTWAMLVGVRTDEYCRSWGAASFNITMEEHEAAGHGTMPRLESMLVDHEWHIRLIER